MSTKLKIPVNMSIQWPSKCVVCNVQTGSTGSISKRKIVGSKFLFVAVTAEYITRKIEYPICLKHKIARIVAKVFLSFILSVFFGTGSLITYDCKFILIFLVSIITLVICFKYNPIKIREVDPDYLTVIIKNDEYARELSMLNRL